MKVLSVKGLYILTIIIIFNYITIDLYQLFNPQNSTLLYKYLNWVTPVSTLIFLMQSIKRKRILLRKSNGKKNTLFSKN